jgi:predicted AAA+ superfamily ATPase
MKGNIVPFDVRFRETIDDKDFRALELFLEENSKCGFGVLLTKRNMGIRGNIVMIPLWLFLLT